MQQSVVRVGEWLVTPSVNQISRQGRQITLEPRLIDLLMYFAQHPDEVLSRDNIIDNVWMRTIVTNHVVTQSISELRKSLRDGDEHSPEYIVTVPKRGYKLTASVVWPDETDIASALPPVPASAAPAEMPAAPAPSPTAPLPAVKTGKSRIGTWLLFLLSLIALIALILMSVIHHSPAVTKSRLLLNPRDIDVRFDGGNSCNNWVSQKSYAIGLGGLITTSLNTFSTYMVHDKTNYSVNEPSSSGKTLTIRFVNQRHYRAQQCFMSVLLLDNADGSTMLDKRYFITDTNQIAIQDDLFNSLSVVLTQPWPESMQAQLAQFRVPQPTSLSRLYEARQLAFSGDVQSLNKASALLDTLTKQSPEFTYAWEGKVLVDVLRQSQQTFDAQQAAALEAELKKLEQIPGIQQTSLFYKVQTIYLLGKGNVDDAYNAINKSIALEMSWLNYVLLGKVYEMKGENRLAADAYLTAFNLRPGENTLYWIENGIFQTSIDKVVPYLKVFLAKE
ncbi:lysine decarboxylation/transport transcriptional activator CadC [Superficieibacter sp. HKU1]|uniref:lysine decarboxylation/transport transcriptional activator CadC n=1 Tax=Superficieibacter sp. HKU1 TaxID=3031919 RepID=UPI0023E109CB|nr:lysine decarboxylation/transport transcriptional activator CadC [Superficieibacter sp. HKU1]WES67119.1 lysine decarboxylation/transport transcriptional activator CadC [Superficieibacter sp. HKU1]